MHASNAPMTRENYIQISCFGESPESLEGRTRRQAAGGPAELVARQMELNR
jgi:hypothetical protein